ncbi:MAG: transcriptional regulator GutM [Candidatus Dormibacteraceae bacterium]
MAFLPMTALLVGALIVTMVTARLQHRYYFRTVNLVAAAHRRSGVALVSGVGRGRLQGAIVILAIRRGDGAIEQAMLMEGASVFARFRECRALRGVPIEAAAGLPLGAAARRALAGATRQYLRLQEPDDDQEASGLHVPAPADLPTGSFMGPLSWLVARARGAGGGALHA